MTDVERLPWAEQLELDDVSFRQQLAYLLERSPFYREKLARFYANTGLDEIARLPLTEKPEVKATCTPESPFGAHLCVESSELIRIYSTSGTSGTPSYIPLTESDLDNWVTGSARSYGASGLTHGDRVLTTYNAGPFVAGAALDAFARIGVCHIPVGTGSSERVLLAIEQLQPDAVVLTPSYAAYLLELGELRSSSVRRILVAGEPGGGEPAFRAALEDGWGARVTEAMGIGDIGPSLWGECEEQAGMHLGARGFVHAELIDPETGEALELRDGATGEARPHAPAPPGRAAPAVPHAGPRGDLDEPLRVRTDGAARSLHRPHRRHADRPRRERLPVGGSRGRRRIRPRGQRPHPRSTAPSRREAGAAAPRLGRALAGRRAGRRARRHDSSAVARRTRRPDGRRARAVGNLATQRVQVQTGGPVMRKLQSQGVHHITIVGAGRQMSIDFWEGVLGMPFVFEQPNLDNESESHLYFDPGDGRLITVFTNEDRNVDSTRTAIDPGCVHHLAFSLSQATFHQAVERLDERGISHSGVKDRGFMDSIYFEDPLGLLIELASYRFEPPFGYTHADVLLEAHKLRVERDDYNIAQEHLADAIEKLVARSRPSLSDDRSAKNPY